MQKPTKLQQTELQQLKLIQEKNQAILLEFGQIELIKLELESRVENAKAYLKELREEETTLSEFLESTYGKGSIDLDKGEFIAFEEPQ
jgi:hypothetical protein